MIMSFGKYKDQDLESIPDSYIKWLAGHCEDELICEEADEEYRFRADNGTLGENP